MTQRIKMKPDKHELKAVKTAKYFVVLSQIKGYRSYQREEFQTLDKALNYYQKENSLLYAVDEWDVSVCIQMPAINEILNNPSNYV